jgi:hypothetical protein
MCMSYLYHGQKRPHSGYNRSQERCVESSRKDFHSGQSSIQTNDNVFEADLSHSGLRGHLGDKRTNLGDSSSYYGSRGRIVGRWSTISDPVDSHIEP